MNEFIGLSDLKLESIEHGICLETVRFAKMNNNSSFTTGVTVDGVYHPISGNSKGTIEVFYFNGYIKMNIPKLMPTYPVQKPFDSQFNVNKNILINSEATKPKSLSNTIDLCNYIQVKAPNVLFTSPGFEYGDSIACVFPNKNITMPSFLPV